MADLSVPTNTSITDKIVSDLIQIATEAKAHFQIWWAIEHDGRARFTSELNRFPDFFEATRVAHFKCMVVAAWKPFDPGSDVSSFKTLLKTTPSFLSKSDLNAIHTHQQKRHLIDGIKTIRNNTVAHENKTLSTEQILQQANITPNGLKSLIYDTGDLVNRIRRKRGWDNGVFETERGFNSTIQLLTTLQG